LLHYDAIITQKSGIEKETWKARCNMQHILSLTSVAQNQHNTLYNNKLFDFLSSWHQLCYNKEAEGTHNEYCNSNL
jgi:hypothetical protein